MMERGNFSVESRYQSVTTALVFGLILRIAAVTFIGWDDLTDARSYDSYAWNLAQGQGYRDDSGRLARRSPIYPVYLAGVYVVVGHHPHAAQVLQAVISASLVMGFYILGRRLASEQVGILSAWIWACYPTAIYFSAVLISETLFVALTVGLLLIMTREGGTPWRDGVMVGGLLSALSLTKPVALAFLPVVGYGWWIRLGYKEAGRRFVPMILVFVVCFGVWGYRNIVALGSFVPLTTSGGYILWRSNHPQANGSFHLQVGHRVMREVPNDEVERNRYYYGGFLRNLRKDPWHAVALIPRKLWWFWKPWPETVYWQKVLGGLTEGMLLIGFAVGAYMEWQNRQTRLLHFLILATTIFYGVLMYGSMRFRFGISPAIVLLAAMGTMGMMVKRQRRNAE